MRLKFSFLMASQMASTLVKILSAILWRSSYTCIFDKVVVAFQIAVCSGCSVWMMLNNKDNYVGFTVCED